MQRFLSFFGFLAKLIQVTTCHYIISNFYLGIDGQQGVFRGGVGKDWDISDPGAVLHQTGQVGVQIGCALWG